MGRPLAPQRPLPSLERLELLLTYDKETGSLLWNSREPSSFDPYPSRSQEHQANHWNTRFAGKDAGSFSGGYLRVMIDKVHYFAHRVIWKLVTGEDPVFIDHIDGDTRNNRFENLRNVDHVVNMKNKSLYTNNKSGFPGVEYHNRDGVWVAKIGVDGGQVHLGNFSTQAEAIAARIAAQVMLDYHENHGRQKP